MKTLAIMLMTLLLASCATVQHPSSPGVQYGSINVCQNQHLQDSPGDCTETIHKEATKEAIGVGLTILYVLAFVGLAVYVIAGGR